MEYRKISELTTVVTGGTPSTSVGEYWNDGNIPWLQSGCCQNCEVDSTERYITQAGYDNSSARMMPKHTVMIALTGATAGKIGYLTFEACGNQSITGILPCEFLNQRFLFYYLISKRPQILADCVGGAQAHISQGYVKNIKIPMYPLEKQVEVVNVLDGITSIIIARKLELQSFDELIKSRFVEMFGNPIINTKGWPKKRFDEICENLDSRRKPITASEREAGRYPYYGASGVVDYVANYIFDEDLLLVSEDGANLLMRSTPIAFSVSGKVWVNNHAHVVRFKEMSMQKYIEIYFSMIDISDQITGSAQPKLNQAKLNAIRFAIPNEALLDEYYDFIKKVDKSKLHKFVTSQYDILKEGIYNAVIQN